MEVALTEEDGALYTSFITFVKSGDRSKFSLSSLDRHFDLLSAQVSVDILRDKDHQLLTHSLQLCTAWFGKIYATFLESYINSLATFTLMEYAIWMGKYSIAGALLLGGVNPCTRGHSLLEAPGSTKNWSARIGPKVLKRFFDCFPLPLSTYIVKRVVEMRTNFFKQSTESPIEEKCQVCQSEICLNNGLLFDQCEHCCCEECLWINILHEVDHRGDLDDVVVCPVCDANHATVRSEKPVGFEASCSWNERTPTQRRFYSIQRYEALPVDRTSLKASSKKKQKPKEADLQASSWIKAVSPSLGSTQSVRRDKFFSFIYQEAIHYVRGCIHAGVNVDWVNEYGQSALYISTLHGAHDIVRLLLESGADAGAAANDGTTPLQIAISLGYAPIACLLKNAVHATTADQIRPPPVFPQISDHVNPMLKELIPVSAAHPGAGSFTIDDVFNFEQVEWLLSLHGRIPVDATQKQKSGLCSERSYFCDAQGRVAQALENAFRRSSLPFRTIKVLKYMRFLNYTVAGTSLNPHVDICRVDRETGERSTHTLILYLTNCEEGGETCLIQDLAGEGREKILANVTPQRSSLLLFPHACPHEGKAVKSVPKILLRGEAIFLNEPMVQDSISLE